MGLLGLVSKFQLTIVGSGDNWCSDDDDWGVNVGLPPFWPPQPWTALKCAVMLSFRLNFLEQTVQGYDFRLRWVVT